MNDKNNPPESKDLQQKSRREFIRKSIYASPVLLTLPATPSFAQQGSGGTTGGTGGDGGECQPTEPIGGGQFQMCALSFDASTGQISFENIIVDESEVADNLAAGNLLGTCESFLCAGS